MAAREFPNVKAGEELAHIWYCCHCEHSDGQVERLKSHLGNVHFPEMKGMPSAFRMDEDYISGAVLMHDRAKLLARAEKQIASLIGADDFVLECGA